LVYIKGKEFLDRSVTVSFSRTWSQRFRSSCTVIQNLYTEDTSLLGLGPCSLGKIYPHFMEMLEMEASSTQKTTFSTLAAVSVSNTTTDFPL
jgi:hypothetical protein